MSDQGDATHFGLIRHAQTTWNVDKLIQGQKDTPLTEFGLHQAQTWGQCLSSCAFDRLLSSDLGRALASAETINRSLQIPIDTSMKLRELDWGAWTGKRVKDIKAKNPQLLTSMEAAGWLFCPPGGESRKKVRKRACEALMAAARKWPGETILTVTHEGVIKCLIYGLLQRAYLPHEPPLIAPYHLHWLVVAAGELRIEQVNAIDLGDGQALG